MSLRPGNGNAFDKLLESALYNMDSSMHKFMFQGIWCPGSCSIIINKDLILHQWMSRDLLGSSPGGKKATIGKT